MPIGIDNVNQVTLDWLINVLSTIDPKHQFFDKSFVPVKQPANKDYKELLIHNEDGFFDGLPDSMSKSKRVCKEVVKVKNGLE